MRYIFFLFDRADRIAVKKVQCLFVPKYSVRAIKCDYILNYSMHKLYVNNKLILFDK